MLRYFASSVRNFKEQPDCSDHRLNWEIWITFSGKVNPVFGDREEVVPDANFWIMAPRTRYHWEARTELVDRAVIHYAFVPLEIENATRSRGYFCQQLNAADLDSIRATVEMIGEAYRRRDRMSSLYFQKGLIEMAIVALRTQSTRPESTLETSVADRAERALAWYVEHVYEAPKFQYIASEMKISTSHLRRLFRTHFGRSPKEVFDRVRLERAVNALTSSTATLDDIAGRTGFHSTTDFCRVFKKHFGHPPHVWRRSVGVVKRGNESQAAVNETKTTVYWPLKSHPVSRKGVFSLFPGNHPTTLPLASSLAG
jgi:AraC-like DNA-binding protein